MKKTEEISEKKRKSVKIRESIKELPNKKPHLDFIAALLTIPVLISVLLLNLGSLQKNTTTKATTPAVETPTPQFYRLGTEKVTAAISKLPALPTTDATQCIKDIGPISIATPQEGSTVTDNPVCIGINYDQGQYCQSVWAYRINASPLSDYSNNEVCLYNLPEGQNTFQLFIKSVVAGSTKLVERHFTYKNATPSSTITPMITPTPTPTQIITPSQSVSTTTAP